MAEEAASPAEIAQAILTESGHPGRLGRPPRMWRRNVRRLGRLAPRRLVVHDGETIYEFGRTVYARHGSHVGLPQMFLDEVWLPQERRPTHYRLFASTLPQPTDG